MKKFLDVSLVVCVADDVRIEKLLNSIDAYCEVVVVLNGATEEVREIVNSFRNTNNFKLVVTEIPDRNLSKSRNIGMEVAHYNKVISYDSDCVVVEGALELFSKALESYSVVDGKVKFRNDNFQSKIISVTREIGVPEYALCPAIGINKKIKSKIQNYFFDNDICWVEDFEFNIRAKKAQIDIGTIETITCIHDNLSFKQDLKSAFRYGTGVKKAVRKKIYDRGPDGNWGVILPIMKKNILSGIYYILWNIIYCIGYFTTNPKY